MGIYLVDLLVIVMDITANISVITQEMIENQQFGGVSSNRQQIDQNDDGGKYEGIIVLLFSIIYVSFQGHWLISGY